MVNRPVTVEAYAGAGFPEAPRSFVWQSRTYIVEQVLRTWRSRDRDSGARLWHADGVTADDRYFHLVYDEGHDAWHLQRLVERRTAVRTQILQILEKDARTSAADIATMLGVPEETVRAEIEKMEAEKIILRYGAVVNWEKIDEDQPALALIEVRVAPQRGAGFDEVAGRIYRYPEVCSLYLVSGTYDLLAFVEGRTMRDVARFVSEKLATLEHVHGTVTHFLLKTYKKDGDIIDGGERDDRLQISL